MPDRIFDWGRSWGGWISGAGLFLSGAILVTLQQRTGATPPPSYAFAYFLEIGFYVSIALGFAWVLLRARLSSLSTIFWLSLVALSIWYASGTGFNQRAHDANSHRDYVEFIINRRTLPRPNQCWQCYHPPLYYLVAAPIYRVFESTPDGKPAKELQYLSVAFFALFLIYFLKTVEECVQTPWARSMAILGLAALPTTMIHSARVGNDALIYVFWMGTIYHAVRWEKRLERRDLLIAAAYLGFGFFTKGNAAAPMFALLATLALAWWDNQDKRREIFRQSVQALAIVAIAGVAYLFWSRRFILHGMAGNAKFINPSSRIPQTLADQLLFSVKAFLLEFSNSYSDRASRNYFWNYFLKTALIDEWNYPLKGALLSMRILSAAGLALIVSFFWMLAGSIRKQSRIPRMIAATVVLSPMLNLLFRWQGGYAQMGNARYVFPMFAAASVAYAWLIEEAWIDGDVGTWRMSAGVLGTFILAGIGFEAVVFRSLF